MPQGIASYIGCFCQARPFRHPSKDCSRGCGNGEGTRLGRRVGSVHDAEQPTNQSQHASRWHLCLGPRGGPEHPLSDCDQMTGHCLPLKLVNWRKFSTSPCSVSQMVFIRNHGPKTVVHPSFPRCLTTWQHVDPTTSFVACVLGVETETCWRSDGSVTRNTCLGDLKRTQTRPWSRALYAPDSCLNAVHQWVLLPALSCSELLSTSWSRQRSRGILGLG